MMLNGCKAEVTIRKVDNGFVVEWEHKRLKVPPRLRRRHDPDDGECEWGDPSGLEIFTKEKDALERAKEILSSL